MRFAGEVICVVMIFFAFAGDPAPMVNESHYLVKAKSYWEPDWCENDLFVSSGKAHVTFYYTIGWFTQLFSLKTTAWIGRFLSWSLIAIGLTQLAQALFRRHYCSIPMAIVWMAAIDYGNLAGEWVIGGIEGKVPAFGFVLLALAQMVQRRWQHTWILLGCGSAFHVLTGGWSVVAAMVAWLVTERKANVPHRLLSWQLFLGGLIALFGLIPALALQRDVNPEVSAKAARIYTFYRLPHHLVPSSFQLHWYLRHGALILSTLVLVKQSRLRVLHSPLAIYTASALGLSAIGLIIGMTIEWSPNLSAKLLRFYWFRLSDAMLPLFFSTMVTHSLLSKRPGFFRVACIITLMAAALLSYRAINQSRLNLPPAVTHRILGFDPSATRTEQQQAFKDWLAVCSWARHSSEPSEVFITPRHQQTFKWYAERAEVSNWKDVPQDAASLVQWYERFQALYPQRLGNTRVTIQYPTLREFRKKYGARWMIVDRRIVGEHLPLVRVYPVGEQQNQTFAVYELPTP